MFQRVVTKDDINGFIRNRLNARNSFDAAFTHFVLHDLRNVEADFARTIERGQVPAPTDAKFENNVGRFNVRRDFASARVRNPGERGLGNAALFLVIGVAWVTAIVVGCAQLQSKN